MVDSTHFSKKHNNSGKVKKLKYYRESMVTKNNIDVYFIFFFIQLIIQWPKQLQIDCVKLSDNNKNKSKYRYIKTAVLLMVIITIKIQTFKKKCWVPFLNFIYVCFCNFSISILIYMARVMVFNELPTIFQLYHGSQFYSLRKKRVPR